MLLNRYYENHLLNAYDTIGSWLSSTMMKIFASTTPAEPATNGWFERNWAILPSAHHAVVGSGHVVRGERFGYCFLLTLLVLLVLFVVRLGSFALLLPEADLIEVCWDVSAVIPNVMPYLSIREIIPFLQATDLRTSGTRPPK
ncbi:hypothetical protein ON010_g14592 [Phytophthora cinnamomi]|nr:hypothetical protein ON010_g14592 [Phytophthora cinnamomi]